MISDHDPDGKLPGDSIKRVKTRISPDRFTLTVLGRKELVDDRGLNDETIDAAKIGTLRVQEDLEEHGLDWDIDALPSLHVIPYLSTADMNGNVLYRLHKRSLPSVTYPPYIAPVINQKGAVVLAESEFKALAAAQLGCRAIAIQGLDSFVKRTGELTALVEGMGVDSITICLDTERDIVEDPDRQIDSHSLRAAHTYALAFDEAGMLATIADLPEKYLVETTRKDGEHKYLKADIDGALAQGMTAVEFKECLDGGEAFYEYPASVEVKVAAIWQLYRDSAFDQPDVWKRLLEEKSLAERHGALHELIRKSRSGAYDRQAEAFDPILVDALAARIKKLFKPFMGNIAISAIRARMRQSEKPSGITITDLTLSDYGLHEGGGKVLYVRRPGRADQECELVANFTVLSIRTGEGGFVGAHKTPLHLIEVKSAAGHISAIELHGSLFDSNNYMSATNGRLTIVDAKHFKAYLSHRLEYDNIQVDDPTIDRTFMVGSCVDRNGKLVPNDNVTFRQQREECWYHGHAFATEGHKTIFHRVARLQQNDSLRLLLVWALGTFLKPLLGWAYPHCAAIGDSGCGKDTVGAILQERFGWLAIAGPPECDTKYRSKKLVANSIVPIQVQEIGRLDKKARSNLTEVTNLAYNCQPTTHGHLDKTFVLCAPLLLWGQDFPIEDVALSAKMIRLFPTNDGKDEKVLACLLRRRHVWPMRRWAEFVCEWANQRDVRAAVEQKAELIRERIKQEDFKATSNTDRAIWNYAVLLVVADALNAFGVPLQIEDAVCASVVDHLTSAKTNTMTVARQVLRDLLLELQKPDGRGSFVSDINEKGLFFKPPNVLRELEKRSYSYDISDPNVLTRMLADEGLGKASVLHSVKGSNVRTRFFHVSPATLHEFDFQFDGNPAAPTNDHDDSGVTEALDEL